MADGASCSAGESAGVYERPDLASRIWHNAVLYYFSKRACTSGYAVSACTTACFATIISTHVWGAKYQRAGNAQAWLRASSQATYGRTWWISWVPWRWGAALYAAAHVARRGRT